MDQKAQFEAALAEFRAGNPQVAAELCERSLETFPGDANFLCLSARANLVLKHFDEAKKQAEQAITLFPDFALAHETIGDVFLVGGEGARAQAAYETAMRLDPARPGIDAKIERAETLERSIDQRRKRIAMRRVYDAEIRKAQELERNGEAEAAEKIYRDVLTKDPEHVEAARLLAGIAMLHKRYRDAEIFLKKAVEIAPDYARAWVDLVTAQRELHRFDDALLSARQLLRITPEASEAYVVLAGVEAAAGNHDEAIHAYRKALDIKPDRIGAMTGLAHNLKTVGATAEAVATYRRVIEARPDHAEAFWSLANLKTFRFDDAEVEAMETLLRDGGLPDESRAQLHNALGLEFE
ncbi:MAG: tetratricopeptide repeat protein, partial [Gammaproteobacteria bacterium]|nr:tetratricopeptide repeat protein [Gammaproteobacteria bacterium]